MSEKMPASASDWEHDCSQWTNPPTVRLGEGRAVYDRLSKFAKASGVAAMRLLATLADMATAPEQHAKAQACQLQLPIVWSHVHYHIWAFLHFEQHLHLYC